MEKKIVKFIVSILLCQMAGIIGVGFTASAIPVWYDTLIKPSFNPPAWIFGPVWTTLYFLMGLSLFFVWISSSKTKQKALFLFFTQLFLNAIWSPVFFGLRSTFVGLIIVAFLWISIVLTMIHFYKISKTSTALLVPYFLWVSFAAVLNFSIWQLNS